MTNLVVCLNKEKTAILELVALMEIEQNYLIEANIASLQDITSKKTKIINEISELGNYRNTILVSIGYESENIGLQEYLGKKNDKEAFLVWSHILLLAKSAKELNNTNGLLLNKHLTQNKNTLNVLQGIVPGTGFYGPDGQSKSTATTRNLVIG